jgi:hypothetical protein
MAGDLGSPSSVTSITEEYGTIHSHFLEIAASFVPSLELKVWGAVGCEMPNSGAAGGAAGRGPREDI